MSDEQDKNVRIEEVEAVTAPPKARVEITDHFPEGHPRAEEKRPRDYLEGFLSEKPKPVSTAEPGGDVYEGVIDALKEIYDPEIPVNIYELGLIYGVDVTADNHVAVTMTLTTPHCPVAESMPAEVELRVGAVPGVGDAEVNLVWDPPWSPQNMSDEARLELGML